MCKIRNGSKGGTLQGSLMVRPIPEGNPGQGPHTMSFHARELEVFVNADFAVNWEKNEAWDRDTARS